MTSSAELLRLDADALAERLIRVAHEARKLTEEGRTADVAELLANIRGAADEATGAALALLEVSGAFLRALSSSDVGGAELALRRFVLAQQDGGASALGPLACGASMEAGALVQLGAIGQDLLDVGVLRALPEGRYDLRPSLRSLARELVEPAVFRSWRRVTNARATAALGQMNERDTTAHLARELGVTPQQARMHLRLSPITAAADCRWSTAAIPPPATAPAAASLQAPPTASSLLDARSVNRSQLADILRVRRPTLDEWLEGKEPSADRAARIESIARLLATAGVRAGHPLNGGLVRRAVPDHTASLLDVLRAEVIDEPKAIAIVRGVLSLEAAKTKKREDKERSLRTHGFEPVDASRSRDILAANVASFRWQKP